MSFNNNKEKITRHELVKSLQETLDRINDHRIDKFTHITAEDKERWDNSAKLIPNYAGLGDSFFSEEAREKLNKIEVNANNYRHPKGRLTPGKYLDVRVDEYGHVEYANNPKRLSCTAKDASRLSGVPYSEFIFANGSNFPRDIKVRNVNEELLDQDAVTLGYLLNNSIDTAFITGNSENINIDEKSKIYINTDTDNAYFFDGNQWKLIGGNSNLKLDKDGFIPDKYIPTDINFSQPVGEIAMCQSIRPPKGWVSLDGSIYNRKDLPELWEYANKHGLVVSESQWKTVYSNKANTVNYNLVGGLFSSGDGVNTFRVPAFFGEPLYTNNAVQTGETSDFKVKRLQGKIQAFYDYTRTDNINYGGFKSFQVKESSNMPSIHLGRNEALSEKINYSNIREYTNSKFTFRDNSTNVNITGFITIKPNNTVPVANEFRPRQIYTNFIIKACKFEGDFPLKLMRAKHVPLKFDLSSYALDIYNRNIIYGHESLGEYIANNLYLGRIILDLSHWKKNVVDFLDTPYALNSLIFNNIRVEFSNLSGIKYINYPFNIEANKEFLKILCLEKFVDKEPEIPEGYKMYPNDKETYTNSEGEEIQLKERPVNKIVNTEEEAMIDITINPLFARRSDKYYTDFLLYRNEQRYNTTINVDLTQGSLYGDSYEINVEK